MASMVLALLTVLAAVDAGTPEPDVAEFVARVNRPVSLTVPGTDRVRVRTNQPYGPGDARHVYVGLSSGGVFESLDYVYMPSRDVARDVTYFTDVLGGRLVFAIDGMGTRVAMVELTEGPPRLLLAGHLDDDQPILVYRVADLEVPALDLELHRPPPSTHCSLVGI